MTCWSLFLAALGLLLPVLLLPQLVRAAPTPPEDGAAWTLIWSDEFNSSGALDPADWLYDLGTSYPGGPANWGTGEIQTYTDTLDNVFQGGGSLHIRPLQSGDDPLTGWTSGRIETVRTDFQPPAGGGLAVEASLKLPELSGEAAQGYWPAFWMLGAPFRGDFWNWPGIGEIDIMENVNLENHWWGAFHCGTYPGGPCSEPAGLSGEAQGFSPGLGSAFHTYRLEFDRSVAPEELRWYVDGVQRFRVRASQVDDVAWKNATGHGFFILLNLAIGGGWPGAPTGLTASGGEMLVDYVRVYAWPVEPPPPHRSVYLPLVSRFR